MKVLVPGSRGLLGTTLTAVLQSQRHEVIIFEGDISDEQNVKEQVRHTSPDAIVNASAIADVKVCEEEPEKARAVNALGQKYLVEMAQELSIPIIYISTVSVFNGEGNYKEDDIPNPQNVYNKTKREGELHTLAYQKGIVARVNIIGIHRNGSRGKAFLEWMIDTIKANKDLTLYTDSRINPLSNITLSDLILKLLERPPEYQIIHLGSKDVISKADIGEMVLSYFPEYAGEVTRTPQSTQSTQPREMWLNVERAAKLFGPLPSVSEEVQKILLNKNVAS
ncbi:MAG: NAD(P)-dependent oxidoreductase [Patescibacteria group bacterium]